MTKRRNAAGVALAGCIGMGILSLAAIKRTSGGGSIIIGAGFSGNRINADTVSDQLAAAIAAHPSTPEITDEWLGETLNAIRDRAREGDLEAALVLFRIADKQRTSPDG